MALINLVNPVNGTGFPNALLNDIQICGKNSSANIFIGASNSLNYIQVSPTLTTMSNIYTSGATISNLIITGQILSSNATGITPYIAGGTGGGGDGGGGLTSIPKDLSVETIQSTIATTNLMKVNGRILLTGGAGGAGGDLFLPTQSFEAIQSSIVNVGQSFTISTGASVIMPYGCLNGNYINSLTNINIKKLYATQMYASTSIGVNNPSPVYEIDVNGTIKTTRLIETSDIRTKQNIEPIVVSRETLKKLRPVLFSFKNDKNNQRQAGLIAQEVEKILPDVVVTTTDYVPIESMSEVGIGKKVKLNGDFCTTIVAMIDNKYIFSPEPDSPTSTVTHVLVDDFKTINYSSLITYILAAL
jgi:hypothetical protein